MRMYSRKAPLPTSGSGAKSVAGVSSTDTFTLALQLTSSAMSENTKSVSQVKSGDEKDADGGDCSAENDANDGSSPGDIGDNSDKCKDHVSPNGGVDSSPDSDVTARLEIWVYLLTVTFYVWQFLEALIALM